MTARAVLSLAALVVMLSVAAPGALAHRVSHGALTQLVGTGGCVSASGSSGACADVDGLQLADDQSSTSVAISPDGKNVYVVSVDSDAVTVFSRDAAGKLKQIACASETGSAGMCTDAKALDGAASVAVSPDGKNVYVASRVSDALAVFARNPATGNLLQLAATAGCISENGSGGACADGKAIDYASSVAVSPDGKSVYVASGTSDALAIFTRNESTGKLSQAAGTSGCISETGSAGACTDGKALDGARALTVAPDGKNVYTAAWTNVANSSIAVFARDKAGALVQLAGTAGCTSESGSAGACADGLQIVYGRSLTASFDGRHLYLAAFGSSVAVFTRSPANGALTQEPSVVGSALSGPTAVAISPNDKNVYATGAAGSPLATSNAVNVFKRNPLTGQLSALAGTAGCVAEPGSGAACVTGKALAYPLAVAVSPDAKSVYAASSASDAIAVFARHV